MNSTQAYNAAVQSFAAAGSVKASDPTNKFVSGDCSRNVAAAVNVVDDGTGSVIKVKSKLDIAPNLVGFETGDRQKCIDNIARELRQRQAIR